MARNTESTRVRSASNLDDVNRAFDHIFGVAGEPARELVSMRQAVDEIYQHMGRQGGVSDVERNSMAEILCRQMPLYALSGEGEVQPVAAEALRNGKFVAGGEAFVFTDGRPPHSPPRRLAHGVGRRHSGR